MSGDDWKTLVDRLDFPPLTLDERASAIAAELSKGSPSKLFCRMLAGMIEPSGKNSTQYALRLMNKKAGRPKVDRRVARRMEKLVDTDKLSVDAAVAEIQKEFGVKGNKATKCMAALREGRLMRERERALDMSGAASPE